MMMLQNTEKSGPVITIMIFEQVTALSGQHAAHVVVSQDTDLYDMVCGVVADSDTAPYVDSYRALLATPKGINNELFDCVQAVECISQKDVLDFFADWLEQTITAEPGVAKKDIADICEAILEPATNYLNAHPEIKGYALAYFETMGPTSESDYDIPSEEEIQADLQNGYHINHLGYY